MDSIPQELIDAIINNVPQSSLPSCSLVAKRWRQKSQRRVLSTISFSSEDKVNRWCTDIPRDSDGISSYVRHVKIQNIFRWAEPALFGCMLETLSSLTELSLDGTDIPDEFLDLISRGEFGKGITALCLDTHTARCATMASMILSLPDLKELTVECGTVPKGPPPTDSVTPAKGAIRLIGATRIRGRDRRSPRQVSTYI
jgi:hypothetical protein